MIGPTNALTVTGTVDPGSVTVGSNLKPVKLVNGVATAVDNDLVDTKSTQTITGVKTLNSQNFTSFSVRSARTSGNIGGMNFVQGNDVTTGQVYGHTSGSILLNIPLGPTDGAGVMVMNQRSYLSTNTNDVVTIGTLQASTDVVHRSGTETVNGVKYIPQICIPTNIVNSQETGYQEQYKFPITYDDGTPLSNHILAKNGSLVMDQWLAYKFVNNTSNADRVRLSIRISNTGADIYAAYRWYDSDGTVHNKEQILATFNRS